MRVTRLKDYWKGADGYCRRLVLTTKKYTIDDIINCNKEVVLFNWDPSAAFVISVLKNLGIKIKYVCDVKQIREEKSIGGEWKSGMA